MHLSSVIVTGFRVALFVAAPVITNLAIGTEQAVAADEVHNTGCDKTGAAIEVATGWTLVQAQARSPALANTQTPGFDAGLSAFVSKPASFKYVGGVPFEISCPHMVSVTPRNGRVGAVQVGFVASDPYDLDQAIDLMVIWRNTFDAMHLDAPPDLVKRDVVSIEQARSFFHLKTILNLSPIGQSLGVWRRGTEIVSVGIERWNVAPMNLPAKFMYVVEINVSDGSL